MEISDISLEMPVKRIEMPDKSFEIDETSRFLLDENPLAIYIIRDRKLLYANKKMLELFSLDDFSKLEGKDPMQCVHPLDRKKVMESLKKRQSGEEKEKNYRFRLMNTGDGHFHWAEVRSLHIKYKGQNGVMGFMRDITQDIRQLEKLENRNRQLEALHQVSSILERRDISLDGQLNRIMGVMIQSLSAIVGTVHILDDEKKALIMKAKHNIPDKILGYITRIITKKDIAWRAVEKEGYFNYSIRDHQVTPYRWMMKQSRIKTLISAPVMNGKKIIGVITLGMGEYIVPLWKIQLFQSLTAQASVVVTRTMTDLDLDKKNRQLGNLVIKLERANKTLSEFEQMKTNLLSNISHELRTPLVSIKGYIDLMADGRLGEITDIQAKSLGVCKNNLDKLVRLINSLLAFTRLEFGEEALKKNKFMVKDLVEDAKSMIGAKSQKLLNRIRVSERGEGLEIFCDGPKITEVIYQLLDNGLKFSDDDKMVEVEYKSYDDKVEITVIDQGIGISEQDQGHIFERFYQIDSAPSRQYEGLGIGLGLAASIVKLHGGTIRIESALGKGSSFTFALGG